MVDLHPHYKKSPKFLTFIYKEISSLSRFCICFSLLFIIPLIIISFSWSYSTNRTATTTAAAISPSTECRYGRIYIYDLPSALNSDLLLHNCTDLDRRNWECGIATNHGVGSPAAELRLLLPHNLSESWYQTSQYALEPIFHHRVLRHKCRTASPESAAAFYIPFYAGMAVGKFLYANDTALLDRHVDMMLRWIQTLSYWKKYNGSDHFTAIGRTTWEFRRLTNADKTWGSSFLNKAAMKRVNRFIIERATYDDRDIGIPYPTGFHPSTAETLKKWQEFIGRHNRPSLFTFVGGARDWVSNDFRAMLLRYCQSASPSCRAVDCAAAHCEADMSASMEAFLGSEFCLQPRGDTFTRRSVFDCIIAGSVPVFFWEKTARGQYDWFLPPEPDSYSVFIDRDEVRNRSEVIKEVLMGYSKEEIRRKRKRVIESIPRIIYGIDNGGLDFDDAIDIALGGVLERIQREKRTVHRLRVQ